MVRVFKPVGTTFTSNGGVVLRFPKDCKGDNFYFDTGWNKTKGDKYYFPNEVIT